MTNYDVIIIGGACAGLTAGLYSSRRALKTLILTKNIGGQVVITTEVENYPGTGEPITGPALMEKFRKQAVDSGTEIKMGEVTKVEKQGDLFIVKTTDSEYEAKAVILAFGLEQRKIGVKGEGELTGRGVAYCATCDGPLFKKKVVSVVGGGNSAFDAVDYLSDICEKVYLFVRKGEKEYRAEKVLIDAVKAKKNVEIMNFTEVKEIVGEQKVEGVKIINNETKEEKEIDLDAVFVEIGWKTQTAFVDGLVDLSDGGYVKIDNISQTSTEGLFAAGDVTDTPYKQIVISAGEGAKAALSAYSYIQKQRGKAAQLTDFNRRKK
ncbi:thioredoxin-disulfide reductase [Candidatus Falkowbacteria bacterium]|jgi:thioredoxin reductase (NADPH)|nr:thioredoxin-disulfide reductase [Candidatus Falkowbacteria bacterium]MBT7006977.1 thioredoxin-disulfide reductase [Candidatus Falkowbacteria bacterium]